MLVEFVGQSVQDSGNRAINTGRLVNCYREAVMAGGKSQYVIQNVLGQDLLSDTGVNAVRRLGRGNGSNWVAGNARLYQLANDGTLTERATIADDEVTAIEGNYSDVTVTAGGNFYVWDGSTITEPTGQAFSSFGHHFFVGDYTVLLEQNGKRFQWSTLGDATSWDALDFATANKNDDNLVRGFEIAGSALLMCERSTELWQITGTGGSTAFSFVTSWNRGLKSANLAVSFDDTLFFVGEDNNVYIGYGTRALDITLPAINTAIAAGAATHCFYYEDRGHKFCVLRFSDRPAWVFDVKMQEWHERSEGADIGAFRAVDAIEGDTWQIGNTVGEIHSLSRTGKDLNAPLRRVMQSLPIYTGDKFSVDVLEVNFRVGNVTLNEATDYVLGLDAGFALALDAGFALQVDSEPAGERAGEVHLRISRDGGENYGGRKTRSLGRFGEYSRRTKWNGLGQAHQFTAMIEISEPGDYQMNSTAVLEVS